MNGRLPFLICCASIATPLAAQTATRPNGDATLAAMIAGDGQPVMGVTGDESAVDAVEAFAHEKGWRTERLIRRSVNVGFGQRPSERDVADFLLRLRTKAFGSATSTGVLLFGSPSYAPPTPPAEHR